MTRRSFLSSLLRTAGVVAAMLAGARGAAMLGLLTRSRDPRGAPKRPVMPPGAGTGSHFFRACTGCNRCVAKCPTGVLRPSLAEYGLAGSFQPVLDFSAGYCEYLCTACGEACPTGAIGRLSAQRKEATQIGRVYLVKDDCIVFTKGTACGACSEICPTQAVRMAPYRPGLTQPIVDQRLCIGCGGCELACPARPRKAIYVVGVDPQPTISPLYTAPSSAAPKKGKSPEAIPPPGDFPF